MIYSSSFSFLRPRLYICKMVNGQRMCLWKNCKKKVVHKKEMPKCKNDPKRSYQGSEPSPKGLGYCAHACKEKTVMKGRDGAQWKVVRTKDNILRWQKVAPITATDLVVPDAHTSFLKDIKKASRPAEMLIYDWATLTPDIRSKVISILKNFSHRTCTATQNVYSPTTRCLRFTHMRDADRAMDLFDKERLGVNIDISYAS